jgi:hypothetical protein
MAEYRMLQALVTLAIPDFEIRDRKHPFDEYVKWHRIKLIKEPNDYNRYCLAKALIQDMKPAEARYLLQQCSQNEPVTHFLIGTTYLIEGNNVDGLPLREFRLQTARYPLHQIGPQWDGKPTDKRLIVWQEGGFGDVIQYCRYLPSVLERAPNAKMVIDRSLYSLIKYNYSESLIAFDPSQFDIQCSMMSLPHLLGQYVPDTRSYLGCSLDWITKWKQYRGKIGFCSRGNPLHSSDRLRSLTPDEVDQIRQPHWVSLAPEDTLAEDWADTAGIIANLDLVITVDTAVGHIAGALGVPVWVMMNKHHDWRWEQKWYNSMRVFRCVEHSDWKPVFDAITQELRNEPWSDRGSQQGRAADSQCAE